MEYANIMDRVKQYTLEGRTPVIIPGSYENEQSLYLVGFSQTIRNKAYKKYNDLEKSLIYLNILANDMGKKVGFKPGMNNVE